VSDISRLLKPAAYLQRLADKVIAGSSKGAAAAFNGLHLRMEEDSPYIQMLGGVEVTAQCRAPSTTTKWLIYLDL
jgi:hypothetical protein